MSTYQFIDHAETIKGEHQAIHSLAKKGSKLYQRRAKKCPLELTEFQAKVCDIIGMVGSGINNAPIDKGRIDWDYGFGGVSVLWQNCMATFDFDELTRLVFLCHEARIRCQIEAANPKAIRITFWQRTWKGSMAKRHPNLDEAVQSFREYLPSKHRVIYKDPSKVESND